MSPEFDELAVQWTAWTQAAGMAGTSVQSGDDTTEIRFCSSHGDYRLKEQAGWWVVDESDDRGKNYPATATCSTMRLAEKYLIWTWGSTARTVIGAPQLGRRLQEVGFNQHVRQSTTSRADFVELTTQEGSAIVPNSKSVILSHVFALSLAQIDEMLHQGL